MPSRVFAVPHGGKPPLKAAAPRSILGADPAAITTRSSCPLLTDEGPQDNMNIMKATFTALIDNAPEGGFWAVCPEIPGANGQGETIEEARDSLRDAIQLILEDRVEDMKRGLDKAVIQTFVSVG